MRKTKRPRGRRKSQVVSAVVRRNAKSTSAKVILKQMNEPRPLPMGRAEFEEWSDRIISGALIKPNCAADEDPVRLIESQKFALANMLMHLGPTESHKPDAHFIHSLRKFAVNQVADTVRKELHEAAKARTAAEEAAKPEAQKAVEEAGEATLRRIGAANAT